MKHHFHLIPLLLLLFSCVFTLIPCVEADIHDSVYVSFDHMHYLRGETATVKVDGPPNAFYTLTLFDALDEILYQNDRQLDGDGEDSVNLPVSPTARSGTYRVTASSQGCVSEAKACVVETTGYSSQVFPYERSHKGVNYTIRARGFTAVSSSGNITVTYPSLPISFSVNAYANNMSFVERLKNVGLGIYIDVSYLFVYAGMKIMVNGSIPQPTTYSFTCSSPQALRQKFDQLRNGFLVFDWGDMRRAAQQFTYDAATQKLTVNIPQTFTIDPYVFEDGFESNDFSEWTGTTTTAGETATVDTSDPNEGTYHAEFTCNGNATSEGAFVYKDAISESTIYLRSYYQFKTAFPNSPNDHQTVSFKGSSWVARWGVQNNSGTMRWEMRYRNITGDNMVYAASGPSLDTWYSVELYLLVAGGTSGEAKLYVGGSEVITVSNIDTDDYGNITRVYVGMRSTESSQVVNGVWVDSVIVDTSYIGPIGDSVAPTYSDIATNSTHAGNIAEFQCKWDDETDLTTTGGYIFGTNNTATWTNDTWTAFTATPQWANISKTLNTTVGQVVGYRWYANDTAGNWNGSMAIQTLTTTDTTVPVASNKAANTTHAGNPCVFSTYWTNLALSGYIYSTNNTGTWANETWSDPWGGTPTTGWSNITKTLNSTVGQVVGWRIYCNDTSDNWGDTAIQTLTTTDTTVPTSVNEAANTTASGQPCLFSVEWTNLALSGHIFSTNNTGMWANDTWTDGWAGTPTTGWSNTTKSLNVTVGQIIGWRVYANDTSDNWGDTGIQTLTVTSYTLTLQARDKDGTNLPRAVSFSVTFPNATVTAFTSSTAGLKAITTMYGTHSITVTWQTHIVKTATSVAVIADQTQNFDTLISRLSSGSNYVLVSVDSTTTGTPILKPFNSWRIESIQGSGGKQVKVDVANWLEAREPLYFKIRGASYEKDSQDWSFTSNIFTWANIVFSMEEYADIEMIWTDPNPPSGSSTTTTTEPALTTVTTTPVTPQPVQIDPMLIVVVGAVALVGAAVYTAFQPKSNPWKTKPKKVKWPKGTKK